MDLHNLKFQSGFRRSWARNAALLLFLVTGIILVASLTAARSHQADGKMSMLAGSASSSFKLL